MTKSKSSRTRVLSACFLAFAILALGNVFSRPLQAQKVLLAVSVDSNPEGNQSLVDRLTNDFGYEVTVIDDDVPRNPMAEDAMGMDLVVISSTVLSGNVGTAFTDQDATFRAMEIPTIQWEQALHDEFLFADSGMTFDNGDTVTITDEGANHPLAGGLGPGDILVRNSGTQFHLGTTNNIAEGYQTIAEVNGNPSIGVVEPGGLLKDGVTTASAKRIDMFWGDSSLVDVTEDGLKLFDAAINYAIGEQPGLRGDFNGDGVIGLDDYAIQVGNFNTREATHADGDFDTNRRVNLADFIGFRQAFAEAGGVNVAAVPEPTASLLLIFGAFVLPVFRSRR